MNQLEHHHAFHWIALKWLCLALILVPTFALGGTFIGNGGSAQDLDLDAALAVINEGSAKIVGDSKTLCTCSDGWVDNDLCRVLKQLSDDERKACRSLIVKHASDLRELSRRKTSLSFEWADSPMSVKTSDNRTRKVDAVSQLSKRKIIINRKRFSDMPLMFRAALVTHELFHFIKINGNYVDDDDAAPPFKNGRAMLDALGAAVTMESFEREAFEELRELEDVSRSKRRHWLYYDLTQLQHSKEGSKKLLKNSSSKGSTWSYAFRPTAIGFHVLGQKITHSSQFGGRIAVRETLNILGAGANYRLNPISHYLSKWNETHLSLGLTALGGSAKYDASSTGIAIKDTAAVQGLNGSIKALMGIDKGFWITAGMEINHVRYDYKSIKVKVIDNQRIFSIGGAYGF